jgi:hypothetical protein
MATIAIAKTKEGKALSNSKKLIISVSNQDLEILDIVPIKSPVEVANNVTSRAYPTLYRVP